MTTAKRLQALEAVFIQRIEAHIATILPMFTRRFDADELRAIADCLRSVAHEPHNAARAAAGAALLREWRLSMGEAQWRAMWLMPDVLSGIDDAIASLLPTQLNGQ